jgi:hypothetical protein
LSTTLLFCPSCQRSLFTLMKSTACFHSVRSLL